MKFDLSKIKNRMEAQWYPFRDGVELFIRPLPRSRGNLSLKDDGINVPGEERLRQFAWCLVDWKGIVDSEGNPIKITDDVKRAIFDVDWEGMPLFVLQKNNEIIQAAGTEEKNS